MPGIPKSAIGRSVERDVVRALPYLALFVLGPGLVGELKKLWPSANGLLILALCAATALFSEFLLPTLIKPDNEHDSQHPARLMKAQMLFELLIAAIVVVAFFALPWLLPG